MPFLPAGFLGAGASGGPIPPDIQTALDNRLRIDTNAQGLSASQRSNGLNNLYPTYTWAGKPTASSNAKVMIQIDDPLVAPFPLLFVSDGENWVPLSPLHAKNVYSYVFKDDTYVSSGDGFSAIANGTNATVALPTTSVPSGAIWPGYAEASTGTTATGRAGFGQGIAAAATLAPIYNISQGLVETTHSIAIPVLSTATERFSVVPGLRNSSNLANITNGAYFLYSDNVNGGRWQCACVANGSAATPVDSGVTVATGTGYRMAIKLTTTQARFYINGTLVGTITTNLPAGETQRTASMCMIEKSVSAGGVASLMLMDYHEARQFLINPR